MSGAVKCGRPGCAGTIEDGYCDTCGLAQKAQLCFAENVISGAISWWAALKLLLISDWMSG